MSETETLPGTQAKAKPAESPKPDPAAAEETLHDFETAGAAMIEGFSKAHSEIATFVAERIRQDVETQAEFLRCRSLDDVRDVQTRFFATAMDQYAEEAGRLMQIGTEMMAMTLPRRGR